MATPLQTGDTDVEILYLTAKPGTMAEQAIRSAMITCLRYNVEVKVQHNANVWHFTPIALLSMVRSQQKGMDTSERAIKHYRNRMKKEIEGAAVECESGSPHKAHDILVGLLEELE